MKRKRVNRVRPEAWWVIEKQSTGEKQVVVYMWGAVPEEDEIGNILKPCPCGSGPNCYPGPDGKCYKIDNSIDPVVLSGGESFGEIALNWTASEYTRSFFYRLFKDNVVIYEGIDTEYQDTDVYVDNTYTYFVQVISADEENESPPSNYVTITLSDGEVEPPTLEFRDDLTYHVEVSGRRVVKTENISGTWTVTAEYVFPTEAELPGMDQLLDDRANQYVAVLRNHDVVVSASTDGFASNVWDGLWLFDEDLDLKKFIQLDRLSSTVEHMSSFLSVDEDDNIYKPFHVDGVGRVVKKYTPDLNTLLWQSAAIATESLQGMNVTRKFVVEAVYVKSGSPYLRFTDRETGERSSSVLTDFSGFVVIENFRDGSFYVVGAYGGGNDIRYLQYDEDGDIIIDIKPHPGFSGLNRPKAAGAMLDGSHLMQGGTSIPRTTMVKLDSNGDFVYIEDVGARGLGKAGWADGDDLVYFMDYSTDNSFGDIISLEVSTGVTDLVFTPSGDIQSMFAFGMLAENWQLTPSPSTPSTTVSLEVVPQSGKPPLTVNVSLYAENQGSSSKDVILRLNLEDIYTMTIPAGESRSHYLTKTISNIGIHVFEFGGLSRTVNVSSSTGGTDLYDAFLHIDSAAPANFISESPKGSIRVINKAIGDTSRCTDTPDADSAYLTYKGIHSCFGLTPLLDKPDIAARIAFAADELPGLSGSFEGYADPKITFKAAPGTADNGEIVYISYPLFAEDPAKPIFDGGNVTLEGGTDGAPLDFFMTLYINGSAFAVAKVTGGDTAIQIAQSIFDACQAVEQSQYIFSLDGDSIKIRSNALFTFDLYVGDTGIQYHIDEPVTVDTSDTTDPTAPQPPSGVDPPTAGAMELALVFLQGIHFDVWINGGLVPKEDAFDYTFNNNGVTAGVKVVDIEPFSTFELDASQIRVAGLNNFEYGRFAYKVVNKDASVDLYAINANHDLDNPDPQFWGQPAMLSQAYGIIVSRSGDTVYGEAFPDPYFYLGWRHDPINQPDNRVFQSQWSDTGKAAISIFGYGENK